MIAPTRALGAALAAALSLPCCAPRQQPVEWHDLSRGFAPAARGNGELGAPADGCWRVRFGGTTADAVVVSANSVERLPVPLEPGCALTFEAASSSARGSNHTVTLRLDDTELLRFDVARGSQTRYRVPLPASVRRTAALEIGVTGPPGFISLRDPIVGPADVGARGARPFATPPDIALLVADTFRADNLAVGGGPPDLTPELNRLAARSRCYVEARAAATWTLPSHASLFTARYAPEIGMTEGDARLAADVVTLATHLRRHGYRTAAITDGGFVSARFGLDSGFDLFEEVQGEIASDFEGTVAALERVLARDDGRPLFVFVHSYRAHSWTVDKETRARLGGAFAFQDDGVFGSSAWRARLLELLRTAPHGRPMEGQEYEEVVRAMEPNYRGAAADADRGFGRVLASLRAQGWLEHGVVVFTSDHGESFGAHGVVSHGNGVWDGQARVPLLVASPRMQPGVVHDPVSLIGLPRTLCSLADLPANPTWGGWDLTRGSDDAPPTSFVFQTLAAKVRYAAVLDGGWKWIYVEGDTGPTELAFAYDLRADPAERVDRASEVRGGSAEREARAALQARYAREVSAGAAVLTDEEERRLRALGYGGGAGEEVR